MGFFDKIKASVGVGGATIELKTPTVVTGGVHLPLQITVRGGNLEQKLNGIDASLFMRRQVKRPDGSTGSENTELWKARVDTAQKNVIVKGAVLQFEAAAEVPPCQALYEDANDYVQLVMSDMDDLLWQAEGPLPFAGYVFPEIHVDVGADIPSAIDPHATNRLIVLPEANAPLRAVSRLSTAELSQRLSSAYQVHVVNSVGEQWFVWWSVGGRVHAWADLKAVVSVRPEGIVRSHTNPNIPAPSALAKLASETVDQKAGEMAEAFAWAEELCAQANLTVLPRPVGNAVFGLANLHIA